MNDVITSHSEAFPRWAACSHIDNWRDQVCPVWSLWSYLGYQALVKSYLSNNSECFEVSGCAWGVSIKEVSSQNLLIQSHQSFWWGKLCGWGQQDQGNIQRRWKNYYVPYLYPDECVNNQIRNPTSKYRFEERKKWASIFRPLLSRADNSPQRCPSLLVGLLD